MTCGRKGGQVFVHSQHLLVRVSLSLLHFIGYVALLKAIHIPHGRLGTEPHAPV